MRLDGRRQSNNVEDRRGMGGGMKAGIGGLGGIILIAIITLLSGGDLGDVVGNVMQQQLQAQVEEKVDGYNKELTQEQQQLAHLSNPRPLHRQRLNRLRSGQRADGSLLLFRRPEIVS